MVCGLLVDYALLWRKLAFLRLGPLKLCGIVEATVAMKTAMTNLKKFVH